MRGIQRHQGAIGTNRGIDKQIVAQRACRLRLPGVPTSTFLEHFLVPTIGPGEAVTVQFFLDAIAIQVIVEIR